MIANHTRQAPFFAHLFSISMWTEKLRPTTTPTYAKPNQNYSEPL
ncbi:MAG: hypothetical protein QMB37_11880 [Paludibacteraceae bacterium]